MSESAPRCPNCGAAAPDAYCPGCGQEQRPEPIPTVRDWAREALDELLLVEARLPRTLKALIWPPGRLWAQWRDGRRASFVSPLRVYLLAAVPFFFAVSTVTPEPSATRPYPLIVESVFLNNIPDDLEDTTYRYELMGPMPDSVRSDPAAVERWRLEYQRREAERRAAVRQLQEEQTDRQRLAADLLPVVVGLLMVPLMALLLQLVTRDERFASLLVASTQIHAVGYLAALIGWPIGAAFWTGLGAALVFMTVAVHRVLGQSIARAAAVSAIVGVLYTVAFIVANIAVLTTVARLASGWVYGA